ALLGYVRQSDTVVYTLDRPGRDLREFLSLVDDLAERGIGVRSSQPRCRSTPLMRVRAASRSYCALFAEIDGAFTAERAAHARAVAAAAGRHDSAAVEYFPPGRRAGTARAPRRTTAVSRRQPDLRQDGP